MNMMGWSSDLGLERLRNSLLERNPSCQPVQKRVTLQGAVENSPNTHAFVESDYSPDFEHFIRPESCQGEGVGKA